MHYTWKDKNNLLLFRSSVRSRLPTVCSTIFSLCVLCVFLAFLFDRSAKKHQISCRFRWRWRTPNDVCRPVGIVDRNNSAGDRECDQCDQHRDGHQRHKFSAALRHVATFRRTVFRRRNGFRVRRHRHSVLRASAVRHAPRISLSSALEHAVGSDFEAERMSPSFTSARNKWAPGGVTPPLSSAAGPLRFWTKLDWRGPAFGPLVIIFISSVINIGPFFRALSDLLTNGGCQHLSELPVSKRDLCWLQCLNPSGPRLLCYCLTTVLPSFLYTFLPVSRVRTVLGSRVLQNSAFSWPGKVQNRAWIL